MPPPTSRHEVPPGHPERPQRLSTIADALRAKGLADLLQHHEAPAATRAQLERVHTAEHVEAILATRLETGFVVIDEDTFIGPGTVRAALYAAGGAVLATDLVLAGRADNAFCSVRPPGHHACRGAAMGFCIFNNIAVAAAQALEHPEIERVAILDFDVHHGNGTEDIFRDDARVLLCSSYEHPMYPGTNSPSVPGRLVNVPLRAGTDGPALRDALIRRWLPEVERFDPDFIFVSAGFDGHIADPLADFCLTDADYAWLGEWIVGLAKTHAEGRVVACLEGGYDLPALGRSVVAFVRGMAGL